METRWDDLIVLDYEVDFPQCSRLEWGLYSSGAARFTTVLLEESDPWGRHRRPGVLDIPVDEYERALARFGELTHDLPYVRRLTARFLGLCRELATSDAGNDLPADGRSATDAERVLRRIVDVLADLMAFHVLNWSVPFTGFETYLGNAMGSGRRGRECLMALLVPLTSAHLMDFFELTTQASADMSQGEWNGDRSIALADAIGHLQAPGLAQRAFEDSIALESYVRSLDASDYDQLAGMLAARLEVQATRARYVSELYLATDGSSAALAEAEAVVAMCQLAAEEEEQRRRWQARALRTVRRLAERFDVELDDLLPAECDGDNAPRAPLPALAVPDRSWGWLHAG